MKIRIDERVKEYLNKKNRNTLKIDYRMEGC